MKIIATLYHMYDSRRVPWQEVYLRPEIDTLPAAHAFARDLVTAHNNRHSDDADKRRVLEFVQLESFTEQDAMTLGIEAAEAGLTEADCPFVGGSLAYHWRSARSLRAPNVEREKMEKAPLMPGVVLIAALLLAMALLPGCQTLHNHHVHAERGLHGLATWVGELSTLQWVGVILATGVTCIAALAGLVLWAAWTLDEAQQRELCDHDACDYSVPADSAAQDDATPQRRAMAQGLEAQAIS